jgi:putative copper resistance protein D
MTPDLLSVIVRALGFTALFQAAGAGFFLAAFGDSVPGARTTIRRVAQGSAALGALLILAHLGLDAARLSGDFSGLWDQDLQQLAWSSRSGISQLVQVLGLCMVLASLWKPQLRHAAWASVGGGVAIGGFLITGHTSTHALRLVLAPLLALHLLVVGFWFGSLAPLALVIRLESRATAAALLRRFSAVAAWLVPLIAVAGLAMAWLLAGSIDVLGKPYGELLIAKLSGFGLLMVLAVYNKWRLTPAFGAARSNRSLGRSIAAEYVLIVAVLSVTAVLTTFYSPG